jgi:hypothetical protein
MKKFVFCLVMSSSLSAGTALGCADLSGKYEAPFPNKLYLIDVEITQTDCDTMRIGEAYSNASTGQDLKFDGKLNKFTAKEYYRYSMAFRSTSGVVTTVSDIPFKVGTNSRVRMKEWTLLEDGSLRFTQSYSENSERVTQKTVVLKKIK